MMLNLLKNQWFQHKEIIVIDDGIKQVTCYTNLIYEDKNNLLYKPNRQHGDTKTYKNKIYNKEFKESQTYIAIENLKGSIIINDKELINYYYRSLLTLFFRALKNKHKYNVRFILMKFTPLLTEINLIVAIQFILTGWMMYLLNRGSFRLERHFKSYKF